ncbi:MAG: hypothetical protein ABIJ59_07645 [Pseudomonadota bacterium]
MPNNIKKIGDIKKTGDIKKIKRRMQELESLINETKARLPAHSVKPPVMMDLLDYEDEYQSLFDQLNQIKKASS